MEIIITPDERIKAYQAAADYGIEMSQLESALNELYRLKL